jgi:transposase-like protein
MRTTPDPRDPWTPDEARRVLDEQQRVGGSLAEFARQRGISPARLYWWRKRLGAEPRSLTQLSLVPATITAEALAPVTIRLPNGIGIEATSATPAWIAAVIAELSRVP